MTFEEYLRAAAADDGFDHTLRCEVQGFGVTFYVHPSDRDGETLDFIVHGNALRHRDTSASPNQSSESAKSAVPPGL